MSYKFKIKNKKLFQHGLETFDRQYFNHFFKKYNEHEIMLYYSFFRGWIRFLDKFLPLKNGQGKKVLEIGCGIGAFAKILAERGFEVVATDISSFIINKAKRNITGVNFRVLDIEKGTNHEEKFDYIFAFEVLEHLSNPIKALENMKKKLGKKGVLIFSTPYPTKETLADPMHINVHPPEFWSSNGKKIGFNHVTVKNASFIPYLYRINSFFSRAIPIRINSHFVNSTCFYIFNM
ncbi:class I SAM-dependent methyltransferase [Candidatus Daviesbacteria bacterium]|nr:class I SAM-dependent methyltransferase [Candidatus Daviesbacteria bacterium]